MFSFRSTHTIPIFGKQQNFLYDHITATEALVVERPADAYTHDWVYQLNSMKWKRDIPIFIVKSSKRYKNAYFSLQKVPWVLFEFYNFEGQTPHPPPHPTPG